MKKTVAKFEMVGLSHKFLVIKCGNCNQEFSIIAIIRREYSDSYEHSDPQITFVDQLVNYCPYCGKNLNYDKGVY